MEPNLSSVQLKDAPSYPEFSALMTHGCQCPECMTGTLCEEGRRLMRLWDARRPWRLRAP